MEQSNKLEPLHKTGETESPIHRWHSSSWKAKYSCCLILTFFAWSILGILGLRFENRLHILPHIQEYKLSTTTLPSMYNNKQERNKLVDMIRNKDEPHDTFKARSILSILYINKPGWLSLTHINVYLKNKCNFKNCIMTNRVKNISQMSAVVFSTNDGLKYKSSYLTNIRPNYQVWIFTRFEPPVHVFANWYKDKAWTKTMNWSWGYRLDSDIFRPCRALTTKSELPYRDYDAIFKRKTKLAAWVVSHCHTIGLRDEYVRALRKEGVNVDIFGKCSENKTRVSQKDIVQRINNDYKFYLSFENSFCKDYVTEKFFTYLGLDTVLVVRGGINYSEHFNQNAFIDTSSFPTVKSLASFILKVSQDMKLYTEYLRNKDIYNSAGSQADVISESACDLCKKINNKERYKNNYENIAVYIHNQTCFNPKRIL